MTDRAYCTREGKIIVKLPLECMILSSWGH